MLFEHRRFTSPRTHVKDLIPPDTTYTLQLTMYTEERSIVNNVAVQYSIVHAKVSTSIYFMLCTGRVDVLNLSHSSVTLSGIYETTIRHVWIPL